MLCEACVADQTSCTAWVYGDDDGKSHCWLIKGSVGPACPSPQRTMGMLPPAPPHTVPSSELSLGPCASNDVTMSWTTIDGTIRVKERPGNANFSMCIDCNGCDVGSASHTWACDPGNANQRFITHALNGGSSVRFESASKPGVCLATALNGQTYETVAAACSSSDVRQQFEHRPDGQLAQPEAALGPIGCLSAAGMGCDAQRAAAAAGWPALLRPYCNMSKPIAERVEALVGAMALPDKLQNLGTGGSMDVPRLKISGPKFNEALHGVQANCAAQTAWPEFGGNNTGCPSSFPHGTAQGATFNRSLWSLIGGALSDEVRGFFNQGTYPIIMWSPTDVNMFRDPRWGRGQEHSIALYSIA